MKIYYLIALLSLMLSTSCNKNEEEPIHDNPIEDTLTRQQAQELRTELVTQWRSEQAQMLADNESQQSIRQNNLTMRYAYSVYGEEPEGGHSLWISLHGGGSAPADVNDSQWENQKGLYKPAEGIYLCPRAPWDAWNMWFMQPIDSLFEELITTMVVLHGVNPDKIYLMGYSAGGDGVWRLAPRLADHWAAAAMMAGHPGDVSLLNVRNLPFTIWVGALDNAYDRNTEVANRGRELMLLHRRDLEGYIYECHVVAGKGHWMDLEDAAAVPWMAQYVRNPYPTRVVWQQEEVVRPAFYWLRAPKDELVRGNKIIVEVADNVIDVKECNYTAMTFLLNDEIVNLDEPVTVKRGDKVLYKGKLLRRQSCLVKTLKERNDPRYMFDCELTVAME